MPIVKLCCHPGCTRPRLQGSSFCSTHQQDQRDRDRRKQEYLSSRTPNPYKQSYHQSYKWKQISKEIVEQHPYCSICGRTREEVRLQVHHDYPKGYDYFNDLDFFSKDHLVVLCVYCHEKITHNKIV